MNDNLATLDCSQDISAISEVAFAPLGIVTEPAICRGVPGQSIEHANSSACGPQRFHDVTAQKTTTPKYQVSPTRILKRHLWRNRY
jgi:hypothetical protein